MRLGVRLNVDTSVAHLLQHFPRHRLAAAEMPPLNAFGVNEHREGVTELFQNRPPNFVLRFQTVIKSDDSTAWWNRFLAPLPGEQILHPNHRNATIFQLLHLFLELLRGYLRIGMSNIIYNSVIT